MTDYQRACSPKGPEMTEEITAEDRETMYEYLEELRESGVTNMFGAAPYLAERFDMPVRDAREVLQDWMSR